MKKIGILFGHENSFPQAFIERVNAKNEKGITAEVISIDKVMQPGTSEYAVIIDRGSDSIPFYRAFLKNAALGGTAVLNNPFWASAEDRFVNNALAGQLGIPVPKTALLPSNQLPPNTTSESFRNLFYPFDWDAIFAHVGFPALMRSYRGEGYNRVYRVNNPDEFFRAHNETSQMVMMLQEEIVGESYIRSYCIGGKEVKMQQFDPSSPYYAASNDGASISKKVQASVKDITLRLSTILGYDINSIEFAVKDGQAYPIDIYNPVPQVDDNIVGEEMFNWFVDTTVALAIKRAKAYKEGLNNLTWGAFVQSSCDGSVINNNAPKVTKTKQTGLVPDNSSEPAPQKVPAKKGAKERHSEL